MEEGVNQGCSLSSIFAALVLNEILVPLDKILQERADKRTLQQGPGDNGCKGRTHQIGFANDLGATVVLEDVLFFLEKIDELARLFGCLLDTFKNWILISCSGLSILPLLLETHQQLAAELDKAIKRFSHRAPKIPDKPIIPVELTDGFVYLRTPLGSSKFANVFFLKKVTEVGTETAHLHTSFSYQQTRLCCYSQCTSQKFPCLLGSDVMHNMPLDYNVNEWEDWYGPLMEGVDNLTKSFLATMLDEDDSSIPDHTMMILQLSNKMGGLGMLNPSHQAVPNFTITMAKAARSASDGFRIAHNTEPIRVHPLLSALFKLWTNEHSIYLQRFHFVLPAVAPFACPDRCPSNKHVIHFLNKEQASRSGLCRGVRQARYWR